MQTRPFMHVGKCGCTLICHMIVQPSCFVMAIPHCAMLETWSRVQSMTHCCCRPPKLAEDQVGLDLLYVPVHANQIFPPMIAFLPPASPLLSALPPLPPSLAPSCALFVVNTLLNTFLHPALICLLACSAGQPGEGRRRASHAEPEHHDGPARRHWLDAAGHVPLIVCSATHNVTLHLGTMKALVIYIYIYMS